MGVAREEVLEAQRMAESVMHALNNSVNMFRKHQQLQTYKHLIKLARDKMETLERESLTRGPLW